MAGVLRRRGRGLERRCGGCVRGEEEGEEGRCAVLGVERERERGKRLCCSREKEIEREGERERENKKNFNLFFFFRLPPPYFQTTD